MNNKGFSLVELLTVIVIIGILSGIATVAYIAFLDNSRKQAYDIMFTNLKLGAEQYMIDNNYYTNNEYTAEFLISKNQLNDMIDPSSEGNKCNYTESKVVVKKQGDTAGALDKFEYIVTVVCSNYNETRTFN